MENPKLLRRESQPSKRSHKRHPVLPSNLHVTSEAELQTSLILDRARALSSSCVWVCVRLGDAVADVAFSRGNSKGLGAAQV